MDKRELFPTILFILAGASFLFGGIAYFQANAIQTAATKRMAFIMTTIEKSPIGKSQKKELYTSIAGGLPSSPGLWHIDFSGSYASSLGEDSCVNDGQRAMCSALIGERSDPSVVAAVCGQCSPR